MRMLSRYILFELLKVFGLTLGIMTLMFILIGLVREANEQGLEPTQVIQIIPFILPDALRYTVPATILLAACMVSHEGWRRSSSMPVGAQHRDRKSSVLVKKPDSKGRSSRASLGPAAAARLAPQP